MEKSIKQEQLSMFNDRHEIKQMKEYINNGQWVIWDGTKCDLEDMYKSMKKWLMKTPNLFFKTDNERDEIIAMLKDKI